MHGTGFSATPSQNAVNFNGLAATVTSSTTTQLVTTVPVGATSGPIAVSTPLGSASSSAWFTVMAVTNV
ncbi:MAG: IPT/TIG domain-containing protein, partial [Vicinamibacterales bacterium]